jgi:hypothetical protein
VIIDVFAVERIIGCSLDWVWPGAAAAGHKIGNTIVFLMFVVVDVSGEDHEASAGASLALLQRLSQQLLRVTC